MLCSEGEGGRRKREEGREGGKVEGWDGGKGGGWGEMVLKIDLDGSQNVTNKLLPAQLYPWMNTPASGHQRNSSQRSEAVYMQE